MQTKIHVHYMFDEVKCESVLTPTLIFHNHQWIHIHVYMHTSLVVQFLRYIVLVAESYKGIFT
jgi:hypothetical protein